jgi:adenosylhomocysteine nucleosidase
MAALPGFQSLHDGFLVNHPLGFIVALQAERASLSPLRIGHHKPVSLPSGHWLILSGIGAWNAHHASRTLLGLGVRGLVSWGSAGALIDTLAAGDLILPERVLGATGDGYQTHTGWRNRLADALMRDLPLSGGSLLESLVPIAHPDDKIALHSATEAVAVDMESAAIAAVARQADVPFMAIRAVADTATLILPRCISGSVDTQGRLSIPKLLSRAAFHPEEWQQLKRLGAAFKAADQTLRTVSERALGHHFFFSSPETNA